LRKTHTLRGRAATSDTNIAALAEADTLLLPHVPCANLWLNLGKHWGSYMIVIG